MEKPERALCMEWRSHPCTKYILEYIEEGIEMFGDQFVAGELVSDTEFKTTKLMLAAVGAAQALQQISDEIATIAEPQEEEDDYS